MHLVRFIEQIDELDMLPASILDTHSPAIAMFHLLSVPLISTPVCVYFPPLYGSPSGRVRQNTSSD